jgi:6-phosphogluconolactonase (cycloisomerase 2 family)
MRRLLATCVLLATVSGRAGAEVPGAIDGLADVRSVRVSPDGGHVYALGDGIAAFTRDPVSGALTFVAVRFDTSGWRDKIAISPDGAHVYTSAQAYRRNAGTGRLTPIGDQVTDGLPTDMSPDGTSLYGVVYYTVGMAAYARDPATGALTYLGNPIAPLLSLPEIENTSARWAIVSPDGAHVYVTGKFGFRAGDHDDAIIVFERDAPSGDLTFVEADFDGMDLTESIAISPDGAHLYTVGQGDGISLFTRDPATGAVTFVESLWNHVAGIYGLDWGEEVIVSGDGAHVYVAGLADDAIAIFERNAVTGRLTFVEAAEGVDGVRSLALSPDGAQLYAAAAGDGALVVFDRDAATGKLSFMEVHAASIQGLAGRRLLIRNKLPDNKEKNKGVWTVPAKGNDRFTPPPRGSKDDPRCLDDPPGTVRASIRFFSVTTGQDTGAIDLPCENWRADGPDTSTRLGYTYRDRGVDDGPCRSVRLRGHPTPRGSRLRAFCTGKGETTDFLFDLSEGVSQGDVYAVLRTGTIKYCSRFDGALGLDGSDGKKFYVKLPFFESATTSCPVPQPGSPSGALLDGPSSLLD